MSTSFLRESVGITSPITHAGRVVYNAKRDFLETRRRKVRRGGQTVYFQDEFNDNAEIHSIQPYELCFRSKIDRYKRYSPNDTDLSVFSNANGILISSGGTPRGLTPQDAQAFRIQQMMGEIEFAGVACNRAIYDPRNNANEEMLAVQVGGLQTIYNTGEGEIFAGDIILWDKPNVHDLGSSVANQPKHRYSPGAPKLKRVFATVRYTPQILQTAIASGTDLARAMFDVQRRVIGRAMSSAKATQPFDILLGHYCV